MTRRAWFAIAGLLLGAAWLVLVSARPQGRQTQQATQEPAATSEHAPDPDYVDPESDVGLAFFPPGEWWAATPSWTVLIRRHRASSRVALATKDAEAVGDVQLVGPSRLLVTVPAWHADREGAWTFRLPEEPFAPGWEVPEDPADDVIDRFVVDAIDGLGSDEAPFTLYKAAIHDPAVRCSDRKEVFGRLRALLDRTEARSR